MYSVLARNDAVPIFGLRMEYAILLLVDVGFGSCFEPAVDKADKG